MADLIELLAIAAAGVVALVVGISVWDELFDIRKIMPRRLIEWWRA